MNTLIARKQILVVGDVMLDRYYIGDVKRISPEAPVPVFRKLGERHVPGGAANVVANLIAAGQGVSIMSIIGSDDIGGILTQLISDVGTDTELLFKTERATTEKTRFLASNNQQVMRLDVENTEDLAELDCTRMLEAMEKRIDDFDFIVLSDYMKGLLTVQFAQGIIGLAKKHGVKVAVDVKDPDYTKYHGAFLLKPNLAELWSMTGMPVNTQEQIVKAAQQLRRNCETEYILTTCGAKGMILIGEDICYSIEAARREVFDVTGAGDTTISYLVACLANGIEIKRAVDISNVAAGLQVSRVGTSVVYLHEVENLIGGLGGKRQQKTISGEVVENYRTSHKYEKIVFTNGCFDILHIGHIRYLRQAATLGDRLIVGINSDASVRRLKGAGRPINTESDRAELIAALECVDDVVIFDEDTPYELIKLIQPDILVKGGDYKNKEVIGRDIVEARGGQMVLIDFVEGKSTSNIIRKINNY